MEHILIENLIAVAMEGKTVLYVREQDKDREDALCILVNCDNSMSYAFGLVQKFLKFGGFDVLADDKLIYEYYQDRISKTFQGRAIYQMMNDFANHIEEWSNLENRWLFKTTPLFKCNAEDEQ